MSKSFKKIASVALPIAAAFIPGIGPLASAAIGGASGALGGGGLKGALLGAAGGYLGGGGLGKVAHSLPAGVAGATTKGSGLLGALTRNSGALSSAVKGIAGLVGSGGSALKGALGIGAGGGASSAAAGGLGLGNAASSLFSGIQGTQAYKDMEKSQLNANAQALKTVSPFLASGQAANAQMTNLLGLNPDVNQEEILAKLRATPGYQFRLDQGQESINRSLGARGGLFSGRALKAAQDYGQGLADQTYNDYMQNLSAQSGQGLGAAGTAANLYGQRGDIRANSKLGRSNLLNKALAKAFDTEALTLG